MKPQLTRTYHRRLPWSIAALSVVCALSAAQPLFLCSTAFAEPSSSNSQPSSTDESITWTKEDFNISSDGKQIGSEQGSCGFSAQGLEKLKTNHHVVIPNGVEVIHTHAFYKYNEKLRADQDLYIDGVTFPDSLKAIGYGAFSDQVIKGTLIIPQNVLCINSSAFMSNKIEKVVFTSPIDGTKTDNSISFASLPGIMESAFAANNISEIDFAGKVSAYKLYPVATLNSNFDKIPFKNQKLGKTTIEVGDVFQPPMKIVQNSSTPDVIQNMCMLTANGVSKQLSDSPYFTKANDGSYIAKQEGNVDGQYLLYYTANSEIKPITYAAFTYEILPKGSLCTVTFKNEDTTVGTVRVRKGQSIAKGAVNGGVMPANPKKEGRTFMGWNTKPDGTGEAFSDATPVTSTITVYAQFDKPADAKKKETDPRVGTLYRLYNPYTHEHFFTAETTENDNLVRLGWKSEGGVGYIYKHAEKGGVYRLYNPTTGEHHYTTKADEVATCVKDGWKNEGVKWFSAQDKEVTLNKLYSMYNPYEKKFYHHYTADAKEIEQMVKAGWRKEEVKWCTLPVSYNVKK